MLAGSYLLGGRRVPITPSNIGAFSSFPPVAWFLQVRFLSRARLRPVPILLWGRADAFVIHEIFQVGNEKPLSGGATRVTPFIAGTLDCRNRSLALKGYSAQNKRNKTKNSGGAVYRCQSIDGFSFFLFLVSCPS